MHSEDHRAATPLALLTGLAVAPTGAGAPARAKRADAPRPVVAGGARWRPQSQPVARKNVRGLDDRLSVLVQTLPVALVARRFTRLSRLPSASS